MTTGNYELYPDQILGRGAAGIVFRGKRLSDNLDVAVKIIQKSSDSVEKINRERFLIQQIPHHPYILSTIDSIDRGPDILIISKFLNYTISLNNYIEIEKAKYNEDNKKSHHINMFTIFSKILLGIKHLHYYGIAHRDIKPQNIMINVNTLDPVIIDFDLSCFAIHEKNKNSAKGLNCEGGMLIGSPRYMSREAWRSTRDVSHLFTSDLFSLAIIFYYMITFNEYGAECKTQDEIMHLTLRLTKSSCSTGLKEADNIIEKFTNGYYIVTGHPSARKFIFSNTNDESYIDSNKILDDALDTIHSFIN